ncbi:Lrp/AsnC family transcriptional regulator [Kineococcus sp. NPDC059986]|uniref:Lrp/AsnC family transcriptional regulator n=1 Tax=Kineococcus sp. NPDC059986 TaxID=3155538 RepID=UPI00344CDF60
MDATDRDILSLLRQDARMSYRDLASRVGLSANATADRVRRLRAQGVIRAFVTVVDETAAPDARLDLLVDARLRPDTDPAALEAVLAAHPSVVEALHVTGAWDYQLRVRVAGVGHVDAFVRGLKRDAGVEATQTRLVLGAVRHG